jgi:SAM-dependent methyltransferase
MTDSKERFSDRADAYAQYRPGYPSACIDFLVQQFGLESGSIVADIGSGTGILSALLLERGCRVFGVEPNAEMRHIAERRLMGTDFTSVNGSGEHTTFDSRSVDLVTVAQAFHWLDIAGAKQEFHRILRNGRNIAILWNVRPADSPFAREHEALKLRFGKDYAAIRRSHTPDLTNFFRPLSYRVARFPHAVWHDRAGLQGLLASSSFMPKPGEPQHGDMVAAVEDLFTRHQENGLVRIDYETHVHYGE